MSEHDVRGPRPRRASLPRVIVAAVLIVGTAVGLVVACLRGATRPDSPQPADAVAESRGQRGAPAKPPACQPPERPPGPTRFSVVGDFGWAGPNAARVAALVERHAPEFVITTGDNNYVYGEQRTIDANIGQYYRKFICPYVGGYGEGSATNRFFPSLGNHDWATRSLPYLSYFVLPGNERYYDFVWGDVHLFAVDSDPHEPDGITADSVQARWLERALAGSTSRWQIVYFHHPPYSSGSHGSSTALRWPFKRWGADLVLAGHDHHYERLEIDGLTYIVNGLGGRSIYPVGRPIPGSIVRYADGYGAQLIEATPTRLVSRFFDVRGKPIDEHVLGD